MMTRMTNIFTDRKLAQNVARSAIIVAALTGFASTAAKGQDNQTLSTSDVSQVYQQPVNIKSDSSAVVQNSQNTDDKVANIPMTPHGSFDEKGAEQQFDMLWNKDGSELKKLKRRYPIYGEMALKQFAEDISQGNQEKQKQVMDLMSAVSPILLNDPVLIGGAFFGAALALGALYGYKKKSISSLDEKKKRILIAVAIVFAFFMSVELTNRQDACTENSLKNRFIEIQKLRYDIYRQNKDESQRRSYQEHTPNNMLRVKFTSKMPYRTQQPYKPIPIQKYNNMKRIPYHPRSMV